MVAMYKYESISGVTPARRFAAHFALYVPIKTVSIVRNCFNLCMDQYKLFQNSEKTINMSKSIYCREIKYLLQSVDNCDLLN